MMDENSLQYKISQLQSKMLQFHKKVSPQKSQGPESDAPESKEESGNVNTVSLWLMKIGVCIAASALFPLIVFYLQGPSPLFWQTMVISSGIALILVCMTVSSYAYENARKYAFPSGIFSRDGFFLFPGEIMTSELLKMSARDILYLSLLTFMFSLISLMAYIKKIQTVLYFSLTLAGFVSGILSTVIYNILNSPDLLPFRTPRKIEMHLTVPTPEAKRKLNFTPSKALETSLEFPLPMSNNNYSNVQDVKFTRYDAKTNISNVPLPSSQEIGNTLGLPINFSTFFRRLSF